MSAGLLIQAMSTADDKWTARFNGGEPIEDVKTRMITFLEKVKKLPYETILVVSHGWVIHTAVAIIKDISNEEAWKIDPAQGDFLEFEI
jgi:broad specificity phosphatase PhoE